MSNELKDIAQRLNPYSDDGWEIIAATKTNNGSWDLTIQPVAPAPTEDQEATNDND